MRAEQIMTSPVATVRPSMRVKDAARLLVQRDISAAPVVDGDGRLVGIVTEADLMRLELEDDPRDRMVRNMGPDTSVPARVADVMTRDVLALPPSADAAEVARAMLEQGVKRIPIVRHDRVVGIVSRRDLLRVLIRSDADILADLQSLLLEEPDTYGRWYVEVTDGTVVLSGPPDRFRRRLVQIVAHTVPGVLGVRFRDIDEWSPGRRERTDGEGYVSLGVGLTAPVEPPV